MAAILARKLGMTQVFGEDGAVARVTVLAAGPCHVTAIRTRERDGYEAVQLAYGQTKEKHLSKPELGHLKKADAPPMRRLCRLFVPEPQACRPDGNSFEAKGAVRTRLDRNGSEG